MFYAFNEVKNTFQHIKKHLIDIFKYFLMMFGIINSPNNTIQHKKKHLNDNVKCFLLYIYI